MSKELVVRVLQAEECEKLASHLLGHECRCDPSKLYKVSVRLHEPAEQHQGEPVAMPERKPVTTGLLSESNTYNQGWNACLDEIDKLGPLFNRPVQGEPVACAHEWIDDGEFNLICTKCGKQENHEPYGWVQTRGPSINRFTQEWDVVQEWEDKGIEYKAMHEHAEPGEVERLESLLRASRTSLDNCALQIEKLQAMLAERDALLREVVSNIGEWSEGLDTQDQVDFVSGQLDLLTSAISANKESSAPKCDGNHGGPRCADPECWNDSPAFDKDAVVCRRYELNGRVFFHYDAEPIYESVPVTVDELVKMAMLLSPVEIDEVPLCMACTLKDGRKHGEACTLSAPNASVEPSAPIEVDHDALVAAVCVLRGQGFGNLSAAVEEARAAMERKPK